MRKQQNKTYQLCDVRRYKLPENFDLYFTPRARFERIGDDTLGKTEENPHTVYYREKREKGKSEEKKTVEPPKSRKTISVAEGVFGPKSGDKM